MVLENKCVLFVYFSQGLSIVQYGLSCEAVNPFKQGGILDLQTVPKGLLVYHEGKGCPFGVWTAKHGQNLGSLARSDSRVTADINGEDVMGKNNYF